MKMLGGVLVLRAVTAAYMAAFQAKPQVNPMVAGSKAIFATVSTGGNNLHLVLVGALGTHANLLLFNSGKALKQKFLGTGRLRYSNTFLPHLKSQTA